MKWLYRLWYGKSLTIRAWREWRRIEESCLYSLEFASLVTKQAALSGETEHLSSVARSVEGLNASLDSVREWIAKAEDELRKMGIDPQTLAR